MLNGLMRVRDTEHAAAAACVTAYSNEGRLCTQDRHEAERVSKIGTSRKRACLCGMRDGEPLLTVNDGALAGNVNVRDGAHTITFCSGQVQHVCGGGLWCCLYGSEWDAMLLEYLVDCYSRLLASRTLLCRSQSVVRSLRAWNGRRECSGGSVELIDACFVRSSLSMRSVGLLGFDAVLA